MTTPTPDLTGYADDLAAVLGDHYDPTNCVRGHGMRGDVPMVQAHTEHVATALAPVLARMVAEAEQRGRAEGWDEGFASRAEYDHRRDVPLDWPDLNPYRAALGGDA